MPLNKEIEFIGGYKEKYGDEPKVKWFILKKNPYTCKEGLNHCKLCMKENTK